ncbi:hypothetical protein ACCF70_001817 [Vibrio parahaemolyticus]|nr:MULTISPECIES: hypothetical protein [Vibrio]EID0030940.1 hypothetical protein [Vibrio alginolyticus]MCU8164605.1 hypothetical protein [Vibrio vulnificus]EGR1390123.1 hypothetical protein [Vibrio parahaemolyticus]EGR1687597.1 hypothetical protein [Vibrio parahaemolyticus]EJY0896654.1 hypothetical protein [Vibrio parahaemolyticus]
MRDAYCTLDDRIWDADDFIELEPRLLEAKRRNLECPECREFAWFNRGVEGRKDPFFSAHHLEDCDLRTEYVRVPNGEFDEEGIEQGDDIIVRLDEEVGGELEVAPPQHPHGRHREGGGRTVRVGVAQQNFAQQFTLRRILHRLRQSEAFRNSYNSITFYRNNSEPLVQGQIRDVITHFDDIDVHGNFTDGVQFFWGPIASTGYTDDGRLWLNSSMRRNDVSVVVYSDIVDEFLERFDVDDIEDLVGAYVLVAGNGWVSGNTDKPIIWCASANNIFVRRYNN